jgi:hypothetical protein
MLKSSQLTDASDGSNQLTFQRPTLSPSLFLMFETEPISETVVNLNNPNRQSARKGFREYSSIMKMEAAGLPENLVLLFLTSEDADIFKLCNGLFI